MQARKIEKIEKSKENWEENLKGYLVYMFRPIMGHPQMAVLSMTHNRSKHVNQNDDKSVPAAKSVLQNDINSIIALSSLENGMKINQSKIFVIFFSRKTTSLKFNYFLNNVIITRKDFIRDLGALLDSKLYFHDHVQYIAVVPAIIPICKI
ncbi:hypothetical protein ANN_26540 [Periplaneta americana]|uniref:Reverse transcriptase n=1 Tax=Periplaneta americana TaxID=6978 RepID=A0ABQ8RZ23_PERAM|nr:hypothetical protein ANN_26540 [Periplaneta americana]